MKRILIRSFIAVSILVVGLTIIVVGTRIFGRVEGEEFAPDTFERRAYRCFELPIVRLQVSPVKRIIARKPLEKVLVSKKYITTTSPPKRWDLSVSRRSGRLWREGDARILCQYLDALDHEGKRFWENWTQNNPPLAKVLWPEIAKVARQDLYIFVPELFELAATAAGPTQLRQALNNVLSRNYERLADSEREQGRFEIAVRFYSEALGYVRDRPRSLAGRAQCYDTLGKPSEAEEDRRQIKKAEETDDH